MPAYLLQTEVWKVLWPILPAATVVAALSWLLSWKKGEVWRERWSWFVPLLSFSMLGLVAGLLAGFSRQPAVGALLPSVLSLVGGLAIYLVGKDSQGRVPVSLCILALAFNLLVGATWGAVLREVAEEYKNSARYLQKQAWNEVQVAEFRRSLGLPDKPQAGERQALQ